MASLLHSKEYQFQADDGTPLNGGLVYFYVTGTTTAKNTYTTEALSVANANPVVLDADGRSANAIWISGRYRRIVKTSAGATIADDDPIEDSVPSSDFQDAAPTWAGTAGGTAAAITLTLTPTLLAYTDGMVIGFRIASDSTGATTVNVDGLGAKSLTKRDGTAVAAGDLQQNDAAEIRYNSTQNRFELMSPDGHLERDGKNAPARADVASAETVNLDTAATNYVRITGTTTITAITLTNGRWRDVVFENVLTLTNGASLILPGGVSITTAAGDTMRVLGEAGGVVRVASYQVASITPRNVSILAISGATVTAPADTSENTLATITVPANLLGSNGALRLTADVAVSGGSGKTLRVRFGGTQVVSLGPPTSANVSFVCTVQNKNSTSAQEAYAPTFFDGGTPPSGIGAGSSSIDTTASTTLTVTAQKVSGADTVTLNRYVVEVLR
jgi:hypothetical protein